MEISVYSKDILGETPADKINQYHYIKHKLSWGEDGVANNVNAATPLPVTDSTLNTIDTDLLAFKDANHTDLSALHTDNVAIEGKLDTGNATLQSIYSQLIGAFEAPAATNAVVVSYPNSTTETYAYKSGGTGGTTLMTITLTYTDSTKVSLSSVLRS